MVEPSTKGGPAIAIGTRMASAFTWQIRPEKTDISNVCGTEYGFTHFSHNKYYGKLDWRSGEFGRLKRPYTALTSLQAVHDISLMQPGLHLKCDESSCCNA